MTTHTHTQMQAQQEEKEKKLHTTTATLGIRTHNRPLQQHYICSLAHNRPHSPTSLLTQHTTDP